MILPLIIAHRGASYLAPENTLAALNLAWELGAEAVEIDIRLTRDRQIVLSHNATTWRMTREFKIIYCSTLSQLRKLDFGRLKGKEWAGERIATLAEVLATVPAKKKLIIEIKGGPRILPFIQDTLSSFSFTAGQIDFLAFNYRTAAGAKKMFPQKEVYFLYEIDRRLPSACYFIRKIEQANLDGLDISVHPLVDKAFVDQIKQSGKRVIVWTENDPQQAAKWIEMGVAGITTDRPGWLMQQLKSNLSNI